MNTIILWGVIAILCAMLQSIGIWKHGLFFGFVITTTLLAIHYDFGSDYMAYLDWYEDSLYSPMPKSISEFWEISRDPGWDILNLLFGTCFGKKGFYIMVAVLSIIEGLCYYVFIKKLVPTSWYWFAMALYVLNNHFFILTFSMMRQSLVMALLLPCFILIQQKKIITPLIVILILSTIHNSVLLCLPLLATPFIAINNKKHIAIILVVLWFLFLLASNILEPMLSKFATFSESFERYVDVYSKEESDMTFGIGYIVRLLPFIYMLYGLFTNQFEDQDIPLMLIWSLTIILTPFGTIIPLFGRLLFYFELADLVILPKMYATISFRPIRYGMISISLVLVIYALYMSFYLPTSVYYDSFLHFKTIYDII